jgi:hypothetical protein
MPAPSHFNHRNAEGVPGGTDVRVLRSGQQELVKMLRRRMREDPQGVALYILNHTTDEEQAEAYKVYRMHHG